MNYEEARVYLDGVSKYGSVLGLENIRQLLLRLDNPQDDLKFIQSMKSLLSFRFWNCKNGDLSPLLGNPILKDVYFTPNKKHYSHTLEQIKILITLTAFPADPL